MKLNRQITSICFISQVGQCPECRGVDLPHQQNLVFFLEVVVLVDTKRICPDESALGQPAKPDKCGMNRLGDVYGPIIEFDGSRLVGGAPAV